MEKHTTIEEALRLIFEGINQLKREFPGKEFTIDGRLVGDVGEVIAAIEYDIELFDTLKKGYDAKASDGRLVQVKATFKDSLTFKSVPDYYIGLKLYENGRHTEIFNGPGSVIYERYRHRNGIGKDLLSFPNNELEALSKVVKAEERIPRRVK